MTGVIGGWTGAQRSTSRTLTVSSYLGQVMDAIGPDAYDEFTRLVDDLRSNEVTANHGDKMATIERLITLLEGHPRLTLNLTIFLPDEYLIEVQRDAVVIKVYESDSSLPSVDTGHSRSIDNTPRSSWAWMGHSPTAAKVEAQRPPPGSPGRSIPRRSPKKTRKSASPRRSRSSAPPGSSRATRPRTARSRPDPSPPRSSGAAGSSTGESVTREAELVKGNADQFNRDYVYLVELNDSATDTRTIDYIRTVKRLYAGRPNIYRRFVEILSECRTGSLTDTVGEVVALFQARPSLVFRFNEFLPTGCRIVQVADNEPGAQSQVPATSKYAIELKDAMGRTIRTVLDD